MKGQREIESKLEKFGADKVPMKKRIEYLKDELDDAYIQEFYFLHDHQEMEVSFSPDDPKKAKYYNRNFSTKKILENLKKDSYTHGKSFTVNSRADFKRDGNFLASL